MAKTNFEKVEERLNEGLLKMKKAELLEKADRYRSSLLEKSDDPEASKDKLINVLSQDMKRFIKPETLGTKKNEGQGISEHIENPADLSPEEWEKIREIKREMEKEKEESFIVSDGAENDKIIENERLKHINKRFNIRDGWLPLK